MFKFGIQNSFNSSIETTYLEVSTRFLVNKDVYEIVLAAHSGSYAASMTLSSVASYSAFSNAVFEDSLGVSRSFSFGDTKIKELCFYFDFYNEALLRDFNECLDEGLTKSINALTQPDYVLGHSTSLKCVPEVLSVLFQDIFFDVLQTTVKKILQTSWRIAKSIKQRFVFSHDWFFDRSYYAVKRHGLKIRGMLWKIGSYLNKHFISNQEDEILRAQMLEPLLLYSFFRYKNI